MKNLNRLTFIFVLSLFFSAPLSAQEQKPDTVKVGIYITSIHDIDFKQKEFSTNLWIWFKYKNRAFNFLDNLEIPGAKSVEKSFASIDSSGDEIYLQMKLQCVMKDSWKIGNFPFDHQNLRFFVENSQYDANSLVFVADTVGSHYGPRFTLNGWKIDSCLLSTGKKVYETGFGNESLAKPQSTYSNFRVKMVITRDAAGIFWKIFLGMYIAFIIAYVCFYIHADGMDSRFGLSVGALFAVIGNKYIIDSSLPESTTFTLVDTLHGLTLFSIFAIITATAYSLVLVKRNELKKARKFDMLAAQVLLVVYVAANLYFIIAAQSN